MFNFIQKPSRVGGTIAILDDGDTFSQVAFHVGTDNFDETYLRISAGILTHAAGTKVEALFRAVRKQLAPDRLLRRRGAGEQRRPDRLGGPPCSLTA